MIVQAPDNKTIDFGNMPPDQVQAAMKKLYPPQISPEQEQISENKYEMGQGMMGAARQLGAYGLNALQAVPFSDETISGIGAAFGGGQGNTFGQRYENLQQRQQSFREAGEQLNPGATMMGQLGAGLMTAPLLPGGGAKTLAGTIGNGAVIGAGYGGLYGAGIGNAYVPAEDSFIARAKNAGFGAVGGAALGAALPAIGSAFIEKTPKSTILAAKNLADVMRRDNLDINAIPVDQNILQAGDKGATSRAEAIATRGNEGGDLLTDYAVGQRVALPKDLSESLGKPFSETDYPGLLDAIKTRAKEDAGPAYDAAYNAVTKINDPQINQALDRAVIAGDWPVLTSEARKLASYEGKTLGNIDATGALRSFSTQDLDYMTRALRNLGQGTEGMGAFGNRTPLGAVRANTAGFIRNRIKDLNPLFADATNQYAGDIAMHEAAQQGKQTNLFGSNWKQAIANYQNLGDAEKQAWRIGQAENLQTMIANNPGSSLARMNSPQFAKVMKNFYSPSEYNSLIDSVNQLAKESGQIRQITGNSRTATRAMQQASDKADDENVIEDFIRGGPKKTIKDMMINKLVNRFTNTRTRQIADKQVAQTLLSTPFQLAGQNVGGAMPELIQNALTGNPLVDKMLLNRIQQSGMLSRLSAPATNFMLSGGQ